MTAPTTGYSRFTTELQVRPDDIDMNSHVHASRYIDYVIAARFDQMERYYKVSMHAFHELGFSWVVKSTTLNFKRALGMAEVFLVTTWVKGFARDGVDVGFEITRKTNGKICCSGDFHYTLISTTTARAVPLPESIIACYSV